MTPDITTIWTAFHRELKAFIQNKTRNPADTEDILQDAFVKIIRNFDKVSQSQNLSKYVHGIVRNEVNDYFRKRKPAAEAEAPAEAATEAFTEEETETLNAVVAGCCIRPFIEQLPGPYREALWLTEFQELSQKELAEKLGISYSGAKSRVQRGKAKLKALIMDCCAYESDRYGNLIGKKEKNCACA